jgi:hypothetical protein
VTTEFRVEKADIPFADSLTKSPAIQLSEFKMMSSSTSREQAKQQQIHLVEPGLGALT